MFLGAPEIAFGARRERPHQPVGIVWIEEREQVFFREGFESEYNWLPKALDGIEEARRLKAYYSTYEISSALVYRLSRAIRNFHSRRFSDAHESTA